MGGGPRTDLYIGLGDAFGEGSVRQWKVLVCPREGLGTGIEGSVKGGDESAVGVASGVFEGDGETGDWKRDSKLEDNL